MYPAFSDEWLISSFIDTTKLRRLPSIAFPIKTSHTLNLLQVKIKFRLNFLK